MIGETPITLSLSQQIRRFENISDLSVFCVSGGFSLENRIEQRVSYLEGQTVVITRNDGNLIDEILVDGFDGDSNTIFYGGISDVSKPFELLGYIVDGVEGFVVHGDSRPIIIDDYE